MLQKSSYVSISDRCGVWSARIFCIYKGSKHKFAKVGSFVKVSVRQVRPNNWLAKGKKSKAFIIMTKFKNVKSDGSFIKLRRNYAVLLKKRMTPRGKELFGPITYGTHRRKFISSFRGVV